MFKNEYTFAALVILLSLVLSGAAFANGPVSNELDESDYAQDQVVFDTSLHQTDRSFRPAAVPERRNLTVFTTGVVPSELDANDYDEIAPTNHAKVESHRSDQLHCADVDGSNQANRVSDCG